MSLSLSVQACVSASQSVQACVSASPWVLVCVSAPPWVQGVRVAVGSGVCVGVAVGSGVRVAVGSRMDVAVAVGSGVRVNVAVGSGVGVNVAVGSGGRVSVAVGSGMGVTVAAGSGVGVGVGIAVGSGFGVGGAVGSSFVHDAKAPATINANTIARTLRGSNSRFTCNNVIPLVVTAFRTTQLVFHSVGTGTVYIPSGINPVKSTYTPHGHLLDRESNPRRTLRRSPCGRPTRTRCVHHARQEWADSLRRQIHQPS